MPAAPTPTKVLERRGSWRAKARQGEPRPPVEAPPKPKWLPEDAGEIWDLIVPQLEQLGVLAAVDWSAVAQFCEARAEATRFRQELDDEGWILTGKKNGGSYQNPKVAILKSARESLTKHEARLGLSPSDRTRLRIQPTEPDGGSDWWTNN